MKSFFKYVLATITGVIISSILMLFIMIGIIGMMVSSVGSKSETVAASNSVLMINLDHTITEKTEANPFEGLDMPGFVSTKTIGLNDIVSRIKAAKTDSNINGIYLNVSSVGTGFATMKAIRDALIDFKTSDKFIVAYSDVMSQKGFYINSVADEVYLHPQGSLDFRGLASSVMFFKEGLDKLGIDLKKDIPTVSLLDYNNKAKAGEAGGSRVAVLYAYGEIVDGEGIEGQIGGDKLSREIRDLREDDKVKAIVLRVNSPGGSALASESIWREVDPEISARKVSYILFK